MYFLTLFFVLNHDIIPVFIAYDLVLGVYHLDMLDKSDFIIPKKILWKDVDFPENWHFANAVPAIAQRSVQRASDPTLVFMLL